MKKVIQFLIIFISSFPLYSIELNHENSLLLRQDDISIKESTTEFVYKNDFFEIKPEITTVDLENLSFSFDSVLLKLQNTSISQLGINNSFYINSINFGYYIGYTFLDYKKYSIGILPINFSMKKNISCGLSFSLKDYFSIQIDNLFTELLLSTPFAKNKIDGYGDILFINLQNVIRKNNWSIKTNVGYINVFAAAGGDLFLSETEKIYLDLGIKTSLFYIFSEFKLGFSNFNFSIATGYFYLPFLNASIALDTKNINIFKGLFKYSFEETKKIDNYGLIPIKLSSSINIKNCISLDVSKCFYIPIIPTSDNDSSDYDMETESSAIVDYFLSGLSFVISVKI